MPTYSYRCSECDHEFDHVQRITEDPIRTCPSCGEDGARRQINSGNFILKGQGWYSDLYSGSSNKKLGASSSGSSSSATTSSATTSSATTASSSEPTAACSAGSSCASTSASSTTSTSS